MAVKQYMVVAQWPVAVDFTTTTVSYNPGDIFSADEQNPDVVRLVRAQEITTSFDLDPASGYEVEVGPRGPTGAQGLQGIQGTQGVQGVLGIQGIVGPVGPSGGAGLTTFIPVIANDQTVITLPSSPADPAKVYLSINTLNYYSPDSFTIGGVGNQTITWLNSFRLRADHEVRAYF